ncbi:hypothetical protein EYC80_009463 [Monilinia laxa]|uniref:SAM domain-containing protein n=1 Tax=Monilinia laxa TaxID=61186 RepID=A0A5N6JXW9_MONLA|nr:hypothetical protein EYC80_009463 [Monilinia laxa]
MDLQSVLNRLKIQCYLHRLINAGFDTWDELKDITEADMQELDMRLGHRRKLQREIATSRGWPLNSPLEAIPICLYGEKKEEQKQVIATNLTVIGDQQLIDTNDIGIPFRHQQ